MSDNIKMSCQTKEATNPLIYDICPNYDEYISDNIFDKIALDISKYCLSIIPFKEKASLNMILIGDCPNKIGHNGYLGWHLNLILEKYIYENDMSLIEIKELLKKKEIQCKLEEVYNLSQNYLIKPIMKIMLETSDNMKKCDMQKHLNLYKLEEGRRQNGWICRELYMRLLCDGLMEKYKVDNRVYYKTISKNMYKPPEFILPKPEHSKLHMNVLKKLEPIIKEVNKNGEDKWEIVNEYQYELEGYTKKARADILVTKNSKLFGIIEADGKQHYEYLPHFHNPTNDRKNNEVGYKIFKELQEKDRKKDEKAKELCNGKLCLRISYETTASNIALQINKWIKN